MGTAIDISHLRSIKDRFSFEDKKGFVTGAAGGIGRSTAAALAELGADVALVDINLDVRCKTPRRSTSASGRTAPRCAATSAIRLRQHPDG